MLIRKKLKASLIILGILILPILIWGLVISLTPYSQFARSVIWKKPRSDDFERFPVCTLNSAPPIFYFNESSNFPLINEVFSEITYQENQTLITEDFDKFLDRTQTTAFLVIQDDEVLFEKYYNGYNRESIQTSFSVAKSFISALIGIAIDEGYIESVEDPITKYIPELLERDSQFDKITIRHLLTMTSGLRYIEGGLPWQDDANTYFTVNVPFTAIYKSSISEEPGKSYYYNNYNAMLAGVILERATGMSVCEYLEKRIWEPLGMEAAGSLNLDSVKSNTGKMESGINGIAIDFAKFGRLFLENGNWNGEQIIPKSWITESTSANTSSDPNWYYQYFWWVHTTEEKEYHFSNRNGQLNDYNLVNPLGDVNYHYSATGKYGQYIYIVPEKNLIFVRFGKEMGVQSWWQIFEVLSGMIDPSPLSP